jgi:dihydroxy-acid dehydratase
MHLNHLSTMVKNSVHDNGLVGFKFTTVGVSDGISMGTSGMSYSLPSREIIADSIESVMGAQFYDGLVTIPGCDKNMPGCLMAMIRMNRPSMMVYGGTIKKGCVDGRDIDIVDAFQSFGAFVSGKITEDQRKSIVKGACPGAGACGGMYTANTSKFFSHYLNLN